MFLGGQCHKSVADRAPYDANAAKRHVHLPSVYGAQYQGRREPGVEQARRIVCRQPGIARQPGENGIGLGKRVSAQRKLLPVPPPNHFRMMASRRGAFGAADATFGSVPGSTGGRTVRIWAALAMHLLLAARRVALRRPWMSAGS